MSNQIKIYLK